MKKVHTDLSIKITGESKLYAKNNLKFLVELHGNLVTKRNKINRGCIIASKCLGK